MQPASQVEDVYFDTSAFNYLLQRHDYHVFLGTRDLQARRGRRLLISPVVVWEVLLTADERTNDFLVFSAQHLFAPEMLAAPTELLIRYLEHAYPANRTDYDVFTALPLGATWRRMASDASIKFIFDSEVLRGRAAYLRRIGTNLAGIVTTPAAGAGEEIHGTSNIVNVVYEALVRDRILPQGITRYDPAILFRLVVLVALVAFVLELDLDPTPMRLFWAKVGIPQADGMKRLAYVFETYPELLRRGPLLEMAVMVYHQYRRGRRSRGAVFDSLHMAYAPYVREIISADADFRALRDSDERYKHRVRHVDEIGLRAVPYIG